MSLADVIQVFHESWLSWDFDQIAIDAIADDPEKKSILLDVITRQPSALNRQPLLVLERALQSLLDLKERGLTPDDQERLRRVYYSLYEAQEPGVRDKMAELLGVDPSELQGDKVVYLQDLERRRAAGPQKGSKGSKVQISKADLDRKIAESTGLLADLDSMTDSSIFGTGGLDSSVSNALGGLIGSQYGNQYGSGGLGSRGSGFGGGGTAAGLGGLGTRGTGVGSGYGRGGGFYGDKGDGSAPRVSAKNPTILGGLDQFLVDRVIKNHLPQFRYYFQNELEKNPDLSGEIVVEFVIATDGTVSSATTKSSTMSNPSFEQSINDLFLKMKFPEPKGNGVVIVSYPFVFRP